MTFLGLIKQAKVLSEISQSHWLEFNLLLLIGILCLCLAPTLCSPFLLGLWNMNLHTFTWP